MEVSPATTEDSLLDMALFVDLDHELSSDDLAHVPEFFADCVLDDELLESLITSTLSADEHTARPLTVAVKSSRYRNRRREELELLRNTVKTLEVRLAALKARPKQHANERGTMTAFSQIWEALALKESCQRQKAESENKELRETVEMHMQLAQKLDQVLQRVAAHVNIM